MQHNLPFRTCTQASTSLQQVTHVHFPSSQINSAPHMPDAFITSTLPQHLASHLTLSSQCPWLSPTAYPMRLPLPITSPSANAPTT